MLATAPVRRFAPEVPPLVDEGVGQQVRNLLAGMYPAGACERRREQRYPFPRLILLVPVDDDGETPCGPAITAAGKQISEAGLSFYHPDPLPYRLMMALTERNNGEQLGFLIDLDWCRFTRHGWYESGGKFLRCAVPPNRPARNCKSTHPRA